jgi:glycosyltransferase involved in cell wall biosynthesis
MKICSPQIGISPDSNLGGAVHDREFLKVMAAAGHQVYIPLPQGEDYEPQPNWQIYRTPRHRFYTYEYNWLFYKTLQNIWSQHHFDILRIHTPSLAPLGWALKRSHHVPTVAHYHHLTDNSTQNLINRLFIHHYDLITTDSLFSAKQFNQKFHLEAGMCHVIYNGVAAKYKPGPSDEHLVRSFGLVGKTVLLYLGVLEPRKNLPFLLRVFDRLHREYPHTTLIIAGAGSQEQYLKSIIKSFELDEAVRMIGYVKEAQKITLYRLAKIFVFPSLMEGFGLSVAEAMACGIPVVASHRASLPEVVGEAGLLADPCNEDNFFQKIHSLLTDEVLYHSLSRAGYERIRETFSWEHTASLAQQAYQELLEG